MRCVPLLCVAMLCVGAGCGVVGGIDISAICNLGARVLGGNCVNYISTLFACLI